MSRVSVANNESASFNLSNRLYMSTCLLMLFAVGFGNLGLYEILTKCKAAKGNNKINVGLVS
ncbi:hypothetical protein Hanom_Chr12g01138201 [Helianthus anomalus]